jgi:hypothetical protein
MDPILIKLEYHILDAQEPSNRIFKNRITMKIFVLT